MCIYEDFSVSCKLILYSIDVLNGNLIIRVRYRGMTVLLFIKFHHFPLLVRKEDYLIINYRFHTWHMINVCQQVLWYYSIVDRHICIRTYIARQSNTVNVQQAIYLYLFISHAYLLTVNLEVGHGYILILKVKSKESVCIFFAFRSR